MIRRFVWLVAMALCTTVVTTPILRRAYPSPEAAQDWNESVSDSAHARAGC